MIWFGVIVLRLASEHKAIASAVNNAEIGIENRIENIELPPGLTSSYVVDRYTATTKT